MRSYIFGFIALVMLALPVSASADNWAGEKFKKVVYFEHGGKGARSGLDAGNAKAIVDGDAVALEAGSVVEKVYVILDAAVTGSTALDVGDDDDADGFVPTASLTLGTPGMYGWDVKAAGAYLRIQTAGATDAADIYVVPNAKLYSAAGKEVKLDVTGASTAGRFRVVVEGIKHK